MVPFMTEWTVNIVEDSYFQLVGRLIFHVKWYNRSKIRTIILLY